jgi:transcriptional regulator with XRE-family HTH domain
MTIKELRTEKKLSQAAFAKTLAVSTSAISAIEAGRMNVSEKIAEKVKEVYGVILGAEEKVEAAAVKAEAAVVAAVAAEKKAVAKKAAAKKPAAEKKSAAEKKPAVEKKPAAKKAKAAAVKAEKKVEEKVTAMKETVKETVKKPRAKKAPVAEVIIQSAMGGEITPAAVLAKVGAVDKVYIRVDENKAYWVKGEETGSVDLW